MENNLITGSYSSCGGVLKRKTSTVSGNTTMTRRKGHGSLNWTLEKYLRITSKPSSSHGTRGNHIKSDAPAPEVMMELITPWHSRTPLNTDS